MQPVKSEKRRGTIMRNQPALPLFATLFILALFSACLTGCGASAGVFPDVSPPVPGRPETGGMQSSQVEAAPRPLSEEEILDAYKQAEEFYGWFDLEPLPSGGSTAVEDGILYRQVDAEDIKTLEDLRTCLRSVFSQELTEQLLDADSGALRYRDIEGALYVAGSGRDRAPGKGGVEIQVEQSEEGGYAVAVAVELLDEDGAVTGMEHWTFPYAFVEDRWVFTDFRLVY